MYDSLDTMLLMGLHEEFARALPYIKETNFTLQRPEGAPEGVPVYAPFFETVIRYLGGLLSSYALSNEPLLLQRADELGTKLSPVFNTTSGLPTYSVNTDTSVVPFAGSSHR